MSQPEMIKTMTEDRKTRIDTTGNDENNEIKLDDSTNSEE